MYKCDTCKKAFNCERNYNRHIESESHKLRENDKSTLYECSCGKTFKQSAGLSRHKRSSDICRKTNEKDQLEVKTKEITRLQTENQTTLTTIEEQSKEIVRLKKEITKFKQERISGKTLYQKRLKLTSNERELIADSQKSQCKLCESALPEYYHIDHIIALQFGGSNAFDNLQAICAGCHNHKTILETKNAKRIKEAIYGIIYPTETT